VSGNPVDTIMLVCDGASGSVKDELHVAALLAELFQGWKRGRLPGHPPWKNVSNTVVEKMVRTDKTGGGA